jgi:DNA-binding NarL/FixJ family response regulator
MLNVLIADSHPITRAAFHSLVELVAERLRDECLISVSDNALTAFRKAKRLQPDLILLSSNLHLTGGVQDVIALRAYAPRAKLLIVSDGNTTLSADYVDAGADGLVNKRESPAAIMAALGRLLGDRGTPHRARDGKP